MITIASIQSTYRTIQPYIRPPIVLWVVVGAAFAYMGRRIFHLEQELKKSFSISQPPVPTSSSDAISTLSSRLEACEKRFNENIASWEQAFEGLQKQCEEQHTAIKARLEAKAESQKMEEVLQQLQALEKSQTSYTTDSAASLKSLSETLHEMIQVIHQKMAAFEEKMQEMQASMNRLLVTSKPLSRDLTRDFDEEESSVAEASIVRVGDFSATLQKAVGDFELLKPLIEACVHEVLAAQLDSTALGPMQQRVEEFTHKVILLNQLYETMQEAMMRQINVIESWRERLSENVIEWIATKKPIPSIPMFKGSLMHWEGSSQTTPVMPRALMPSADSHHASPASTSTPSPRVIVTSPPSSSRSIGVDKGLYRIQMEEIVRNLETQANVLLKGLERKVDAIQQRLVELGRRLDSELMRSPLKKEIEE